MTVPTQPQVMRPLLEYLAEANQAVRLSDICEELEKEKYFPEMTRQEFENDRFPSGQRKFANRVGWAAFELKKAELVSSPQFAYYKITKRGREAKDDQDATITLNFLLQYDEYRKYREQLKVKAKARAIKKEQADQETFDDKDLEQEDLESPEETVEEARSAIEKINTRLEEKIKAVTLEVSPTRFEEIVIDLLIAMGYGTGEALGKVRDGGIDGVINQDTLGVEKIYIQAKRFDKGKVSAPVVRSFCGALDARGVNKGILVTTSSFTSEAKKEAQNMKKNIILIDGGKLAELMVKHNVGCTTESLEVKTMDENFFELQETEES